LRKLRLSVKNVQSEWPEGELCQELNYTMSHKDHHTVSLQQVFRDNPEAGIIEGSDSTYTTFDLESEPFTLLPVNVALEGRQ
jgi:hypothetical protein